MSSKLLIGIDVGGTNTDAVLIDPLPTLGDINRGVIGFFKTPTTKDVTDGIMTSLKGLSLRTKREKSEISSVTIGTTHFINAIVERDTSKIDKVAVIRLVGPYSRELPPFSDFPPDLAQIIDGYKCCCQGGCRINQQEVTSVEPDEIEKVCKEIKKLGISTIAVIGMFSPATKTQEIQVQQIIKNKFPEWDVDIVLSHEISGIGFLERENLTILNASIRRFATSVIQSFESAIRSFGLNCQILLTQNDGTSLTVEEALRVPIRTFSSGTTNSMRGASFLCKNELKSTNEPLLVLDVGGTTTDAGLLDPNGFPKRSSTHTFVGGVRTILSRPNVQSIGLGAGSIVRKCDICSIGPDSVAKDLETEALVSGGKYITATDIALLNFSKDVTKNSENPVFRNADITILEGKFTEKYVVEYKKEMTKMLKGLIDKVKTSANDIRILLVGGGAYIVPNDQSLDGCKEFIRPKFAPIANAIGAAMTNISEEVSRFINTSSADQRKEELESVKKAAVQKILAKGAEESTIQFIDVIDEAVPYVPNLYHLSARVVGRPNYMQRQETEVKKNKEIHDRKVKFQIKKGNKVSHRGLSTSYTIPVSQYVPTITRKKEWIVSETDLEFIRIGSYILGCGGGGDPYTKALQAKQMLKHGCKMVIIDVDDITTFTTKDQSRTIALAACGSPSVIAERLQGYEFLDAVKLLTDKRSDHHSSTVMSLEIGGSNGFQGLLLGGLPEYNLRVVDADLMGRAYPMIWQISPVALRDKGKNGKSFFEPCAFSDGAGNDVLLSKVQSDQYAESIVRASLSELGSYVGLAASPMSADFVSQNVIRNSLSLSWRIGRAVLLAREKSAIDKIPNYIVDAVGGPDFGHILLKGKIISINRTVRKGMDYGEVVIEPLNRDPADKLGSLVLEFMNENLLCRTKPSRKIIATVPDLITVIDSNTGEAIGTPDYRYGLLCTVLILKPSEKWTSTIHALEIGGPKAFGLDMDYSPFFKNGHSFNSRSVIREYQSKN